MKTLLHASAGIFAIFCLLAFLSAILVSEYYYSPQDAIAIQQLILQSMWVYIPLILFAGSIGYQLGNERKGNIVEVKKKRMTAICLISIFLLFPSVFALASRSADDIRNLVFFGLEVFELVVMVLLAVLLVLNARDGGRLTANRPTLP